VKTNGAYSGFGTACQITSPAVPALVNCGSTVSNQNTLVYTLSYTKVTSYRFEITNLATNQLTTVDRPLNWFTFANVPGYSPATEYGVRVALMTSGVYSLYGESCIVTSPGTARSDSPKGNTLASSLLDAVAYPNPFNDRFVINLDTLDDSEVTVRIYDMTGRLIEDMTVSKTLLRSTAIGEGYPSGVLNIVVNQGNNIKALRVVKR
jgi:hypothetical protein